MADSRTKKKDSPETLSNKDYAKELKRLHVELV